MLCQKGASSAACRSFQACNLCCLGASQVSLAALALLQVCINICPGVLESNLEKLMPLLFLKLCAGKQSIRSAAEAALQGMQLHWCMSWGCN